MATRARWLALNSTGSVISENSTTSENRKMPARISGSKLKRRPKITSGQLRLEPMFTANTEAVRSISGA